jgi:hypothetical protein
MEVSGDPRDSAAFLSPHLIGGWAGPRPGLKAVEKENISYPYRESSLGPAVRSHELYKVSYVGSQNKLM